MEGGSGFVLLVEDDTDIRELLADLLQSEGYTVVVARGGVEAIALLEGGGTCPSLILTDLMMPNMNGWDFIRYLDEHGLCVGVPTYAVTADGVNARFRREVRFIRKPMRVEDILSVCAKHLTV